MAVLGRLLVASAERLDLPDLLSIDSFTAGDFKFLFKSLVGDERPYILKGFEVINPQEAIGSQNVSIQVAESIVFFPGSNTGSFFHGLPEGNINAQPLVPELRKNATNYVYLTLSTFDTSRDTRAFWDPDIDGGEGGEFTQDINTESVLRADVNVSVASFPNNTIPIAIVKVGATTIESIEDARDMMFRLGQGGLSPDPFSRYNFRDDPSSSFARTEPSTLMDSSLDPNPFQGADKNIRSLKEWMDVVMTKLAELGGTTFWYEDASTLGLVNVFNDTLGKTFRSKGKWEHNNSTPGLLTWTEDIHVTSIPDQRDIIVRASNKTLSNNDVMYIEFVREQNINTGNIAVDWFNGLNHVNGGIGTFQNLTKGDWIKKTPDPNSRYLRVEEFFANTSLTGGTTSASLARSIKLSDVYTGTTETQRGVYTKGIYTPSEVLVAPRGDADIEDAGGNLAWLATRLDTIMNVSNISPTTLTVDFTEADGTTVKCTSTAPHGLVDGDRVTVDAGSVYAGTYVVEVESSNIFYITSPDNGDESGTSVFYATVTTTTRSTADGILLESAAHNFKSNDSVTIAGTSSSYDAQYDVSVRSATTFTVPVPSAIPSVSTGTATLARINVRSEFGIVTIVQGEGSDIGGGDTDNILQYVGMTSLSETHPTYNIPPSYNTLDGQQNYNSLIDDNLTVRASKLSAMMADKAQDKTIKFLTSGNLNTVNNTTNGAAQEVTFDDPGSTIAVSTPGSIGGATFSLPSSAPGISLLANQAAYVVIDRNITTAPTIQVADISKIPIDENVFVVVMRLSGTTVHLWDGLRAPVGGTPITSYAPTIARQNLNAKLVEGGTWSWNSSTETLSWSSDAHVQVPGLANSVNVISAGSVVIQAGEIAYVEINRASPGGSLTVNVAANSGAALTDDFAVIARREGNDVIVGMHSMRLLNGQSQALYQETSDQNLIYIGAANTADSTPAYSALPNSLSPNSFNQGDPLSTAISTNTANINEVFTSLDQPSYDEHLTVVNGTPVNLVTHAAGTDDFNVQNSNTFLAQSFIPGSSAYLSDITLRILRVGSPDFDLVCDIRVDNGGVPGDILRTSAPIDVSTIPTAYTDVVFSFSPEFLDSSVTYWLVLRAINVVTFSFPDFIRVLHQVTGTYPDGNMATSSDSGSSWTVLSGSDLYFIVDGESVGANEIPGPIADDTLIRLPDNSRLTGSPQQFYTVSKGALEIFLNGQYLQLGLDNGWSEAGVASSDSDSITINQALEIGDVLAFRIDATGGPGSGGGSSAPDDDFVTLPTSITPDNNDLILIFDDSESAYRKQERGTFLSGLGNLKNVNTYTSNVTADVNNDDALLIDASGGGVTVTLPIASSATGKVFDIKKIDSSANSVVIDGNGSTIDDSASLSTTTQYESFTVVSDGTEWWII